MATTPQTWQSTLNVSASYVTVATGATNGSQVSSIWLANTNATTARTVTLVVGGSGVPTANIVSYITIQPNDSILIPMPNSPIVLKSGITFKAYQDVGTDVNILACGLDM